jgi:hypothetical protein
MFLRSSQKPAQQKMRKQFAERINMYERVNNSKLEKDEIYRKIKNLEPLIEKTRVTSVYDIPRDVIQNVNKEDIKKDKKTLIIPPPSMINNEPVRAKSRTPGVSGLNSVPTKRPPPASFYRTQNKVSQRFIMGGMNNTKTQMRMTFVDKGFERDSY